MTVFCWSLGLLMLAISRPAVDSLPVDQVIAKAEQQTAAFLAQYDDSTRFLHSQEAKEKAITVGMRGWTAGFFPGKLWYLYAFTGDPRWKKEALRFTLPLAADDTLTNTHDLGFMVGIPFEKAYQITKDSSFRKVLIQAARSLISRYHAQVGCIKSWDGGPWHYPVIVDNLMNLELLFRATALSGDSSFYQIAVSHINHDLRYRFRKDFSTYHVLDYDPETGKLLARKTWQGYADSSCWSRGQAWAIYGLTVAYRFTRNPRYLFYARQAADYFIHQLAAYADRIPPWDFNAPDSLRKLKDASAAAIAASALLELRNYVPQKANAYQQWALQMLASLCAPSYLNTDSGSFLLVKHATGDAHHHREMDVPLIYADYYLLQALWRYSHPVTKGHAPNFWF
ncbi:MAG: glycoside hydrolase family 88 protein [Thermoflavifilum sp.]|nr:glycoside hydrolase family 88 protein [Thermoflavifilum sp.]